MNLLADESVDRQIVERLRGDGHDVLYIAEVEPSVSDQIVFDRANEKSALLVTSDKDFGEMVFRDNLFEFGRRGFAPARGFVSRKKAEIVSDAFRKHDSEFPNHFSVVAPGKVRIR